MPETAAYAIAWIGAEIGGAAGATLIMYSVEIAATLTAVASTYAVREQQRRQQAAARDTYNSGLRDRYTMIRSATEPRAMVLGRQRVAGPVAYIGSYGTHKENMVFAMCLAAHEIDGVEAAYFNDERVALDGNGSVLSVDRRDLFTLTTASATFTLSSTPASGTVTAEAAYGSALVTLGVSVSGSAVTVTGGTPGQTATVTVRYQPADSPYINTSPGTRMEPITLDGAGAATVTLPVTPAPGSIKAWLNIGATLDDRQDVDITPNTTNVGPVVTITGGIPYAVGGFIYATVAERFRARVRTYLGAPGQAADAGMIAALPGVWTSAHTMTGLAYMVVELTYDPDAFPAGMPMPSAVVRGAKVFDPRTGNTAWSENPALLARHAYTSPLLGRQPASLCNDTSIIAAANVCDTAANYVVNGQTFTRPLYTAGLVAKSGTRPKDVLDDLCAAMAGRWVIVDGQLRLKAGAYQTPLQTLDDSWLINGQALQMQAQAQRSDMFNVVTGKFADAAHDYQVLDFPRVAAASYIAADGAELPQDIPYNAVTFSGQAQQLAASHMRDARFGKRLTVLCNMRAYPVEVFDTVYVTLSRLGWVNVPFEVLDVAWSIDGGIQLTMKQTDPSIWALGSGFAAQTTPANTTLRNPFDLPAVTNLACASGTGELLRQGDGSLISRIKASWTAFADPAVLNSGGVEIRYGLASDADDKWQSVEAKDGQAQVYLTGVRDGLIYLVKARAFNSLKRGAWCLPVLHRVYGKTALPSGVSGLAATGGPRTATITWLAPADSDYGETVLRVGSTWATATALALVSGTSYTWSAMPGVYTILAKNRDTSGNDSLNATSCNVLVSEYTGSLIDGSQWVAGTADSQGVAPRRYVSSGDAGENTVILAPGPDGQLQPIWKCYSTDSGTGPDGGWNTDLFPVDHLKMYRFEQWFYCTGTMDGNAYLGVGASTVRDIGGSVNSNPYFGTPARNTLTAGRWYLLVGYVLPSTYAGAQLNQGGIWDGVTGQKLGAGTDYQWVTNQATTYQRSYMYYASVGAEQWFAPPAVRPLDGNEPSVSSILANAALSRAAAAVLAASNAQASADAATGRISAMESDGVLTPVEKPQLVQDYSVITTEQGGLDAQATAYGITTEKTAYDNAVAALAAHLATLTTPTAWNSLGGDTNITGTTLRTKFADVYATKQALQNTIAAQAGTRAAWANVSGVNVTTAQLAAGAATDVFVNTGGSAVTVTGVMSTPDGYSSLKNTLLASVTFTPTISGTATALFDGFGQITSSGSNEVRWSIQDEGFPLDGWKLVYYQPPSASIRKFSMTTTRRFAVTAGVPCTISVYAAKFVSGDTFTVQNHELRVEVIKR